MLESSQFQVEYSLSFWNRPTYALATETVAQAAFFLNKLLLTTTHMYISIRVDTEDRWAADVIGQRAAETLSNCYHHRFIEGKVITKPSCWAGDEKKIKKQTT